MNPLSALKFAPYAAIALLLIAFLWARGDNIKSKAELEKSQAVNVQLQKANEQNNQTISDLRQARISNDAIVQLLSQQTTAINSRADNTRTVIQQAAQHDPQTNAWANVPIPDSVRNALNRPQAASSN